MDKKQDLLKLLFRSGWAFLLSLFCTVSLFANTTNATSSTIAFAGVLDSISIFNPDGGTDFCTTTDTCFTIRVFDDVGAPLPGVSITKEVKGANGAPVNSTKTEISKAGVDCFSCVYLPNAGLDSIIVTATHAGVTIRDTFVIETFDPTLTPPRLEDCKKDICVYLDATGNAAIPVDSFKCNIVDPCGSGTLSIEPTSVDCDDLGNALADIKLVSGTHLVKQRVTVVVKDTLAPVLDCNPALVKLELNADGKAILDSAFLVAQGFDFADNCGEYTLRVGKKVGQRKTKVTWQCNSLGKTFKPWVFVKDPSGNEDSCRFEVKIVDNISPKLSCPSPGDPILINLNQDGLDTFIISESALFDVIENCSYFFDPDTLVFSCNDVGIWSKRVIVRDASNQMADCYVNFDVKDSIPPSMECKYPLIGSPYEIYLDKWGKAIVELDSLVTYSRDSCSEVELSISRDTFSCSDVNTVLPITIYAKDAYDNIDSCESYVRVLDTIAPTIFCKDSITVTLDSMGLASLDTADLFNLIKKDECGTLDITLSQKLEFDCNDLGTPILLDVSVSDGSKSTTCKVKIIVEDIIAPNIECKESISKVLDINGKVHLTPADVLISSKDCFIKEMSLDKEDFFCSSIGTQTVTLTVVDSFDNVSVCTTDVIIEDRMSPISRCKDITVYVGAGGKVTISAEDVDDGSTDNCGITTSVVYPYTFTCDDVDPNNPVAVTLTNTDNSNNSSSCTAWVTVLEASQPEAICYSDVIVYLDEDGKGKLELEDIDNGSSVACNSPDMKLLGNRIFTCDDLKNDSIYVKLVVSDNSGNTDTCESHITVIDNVAPTAQCAPGVFDLSLGTNGVATLPVAFINDGSYDACGIETIKVEPSVFDCNDLGFNEVALIVIDSSGNADTCYRTINISNSIAPNLVCRDTTVYLGPDGKVTIAPELILNKEASDCFGNIALELSDSIFTCDDKGANIVKLSLLNGTYANYCEAVVTVLDTLAPVLECKEEITVSVDDWGMAMVRLEDVLVEVSDNCDLKDTIWTDKTFICADIATSPKEVTLSVTDSSGNVAICTTKVIVIDEVKPQVKDCPQDTVLQPVKDCKAAYKFPFPVFSDNCGIADTIITSSDTNVDLVVENDSVIGTFELAATITFTVVDHAGNEQSCSFKISVEDSEFPTFGNTCPSYPVIYTEDGACGINFVATNMAPQDNCGIDTYICTYKLPNGDIFTTPPSTAPVFLPIGVTTVSHVITDFSGNSIECKFNITVADNEAPELSFNNNHGSFPLGSYENGDTVDIPYGQVPIFTNADVDATDNCAVESIDFEDVLLENNACGHKDYDRLYKCTWTATDKAGNTNSIVVFLKIACEAGPSTITKNIYLKKGWNLISSNVLPDNASLTNIFSAIQGSVDIVKDEEGNVYIPSLLINGIGNWDISEGYQVKVKQDVVLQITGTKLAVNTPIAIQEGWQFIPYYGDNPLNIADALQNIKDKI
jgi:hypothetical protein